MSEKQIKPQLSLCEGKKKIMQMDVINNLHGQMVKDKVDVDSNLRNGKKATRGPQTGGKER